MIKMSEPERDALIRKIRQNKDELDWKQWGIYSCKVDFTIDELRQFQDYINWHCYFVYCYNKRITNEQIIEFKDKHEDWALLFHYRYVGEKVLERFWDMLGFTGHSWSYAFKKQKVSKRFRKKYAELLKS